MSEASATLDRLGTEFWTGTLAAGPLEATATGFREYDDRLDDITPAAIAAERARLEDVAARATAVPEGELSAADRVTRSVLIETCISGASVRGLGLEDWTIDPMNGWPVQVLDIPSYQIVETPAQARAMVARWRLIGPLIDDHVANLRRGLAAGRVAVDTPVRRVLDTVADAIAASDDENALLEPLRTPHDDWSEAEQAAFRDGLTSAVHDEIRPAFIRLHAFLRDEIVPRVRSDDEPGIGHLPGGEGAYRALVRHHTTLPTSPEELHAIGRAEIERIDAEMARLGASVLGAADRDETARLLRTDPAMHFTTRAEVEADAREALARAYDAVPAWFGRLPVAPCEVVTMPAHEEANSSVAYYRQAAIDGSRPGQYYINSSHPETRPRYESRCLAYHESVPGHHLQIAIAQELSDLPEFRRHTGPTAFVEGWGLYTERLSDQMGLYATDVDRLGMLSMDAWRACRLVVDTGMHALGWTRQQAIDYMTAHTALASNNIANEVDRYIAWPGQALGYKAGQIEFLALRGETERRLGSRFDIRAFHDTVLGNGAIPLPTLRAVVEGATTDG